ncbi:MAG: hypothetical protein A2898_04210 [Candidatus Kerfeldbacteria bacterium RIFCSPLOWO2_01_FULL_48_11]|uniref:O-antigen ligase-related domain-containing protein n=1 Tax=Candidatus Kerfeldbacteria bacterium RIFCSPLOWO2_01_FULL_48_11 TaxID=1798543 RepID=A0A1G2B0P7_9BACT|nr:MAG: hypothetical protein UY34_C0001G0046 [Parcubacteria group bacterium GW2011_GWA2_48_9]KKW16233.1 MAG: hypothetical protein UY52_C0008G0026 [Parcubacteria group bacterium GW2011_GWC2_49_9]OGY82771.1 MAG: hypothetical protein A2898_04210 [Candidatus Kerfeldbacteria bacterium RIFCSPLOWO2_01_FULL_48_11]HCM67885.1 hypothetical protein [Candidatus Kerfeldbacteria bacterium]
MFRALLSHKVSIAVCLILIVVECLSFLGYVFDVVSGIFFALNILAVIVLAFWRFEFGVSALLAELVIGGKGYLFSVEMGDYTVSLRLGIFIVVFVLWLIQLIRGRQRLFFSSALFRPWIALFGAILIGIVVAFISGNQAKLLFLDVNGYLYFAMLPVFIGSISSQQEIRRQFSVLVGGAYALTVKTLFALLFFSHETTTGAIRIFYKWIRDTGVGEIVQLDFGFFRIFFQSHIFLVLVLSIFLTVFVMLRNKNTDKKELIVSFLVAVSLLSAFIISMSRSIWAGAAVGFFSFTIYYFFRINNKFTDSLKLAGMLALVGIGSIFLLTGIVNIQIPGRSGGGGSAAALIRERLTSGEEEVAVSSRLKLLTPLVQAILEKPIFGHGFGATLTYETDDPRSIETGGKVHTAYAFEWGYLDFVMKFGLVGLCAFVYFLWCVIRLGILALKKSGTEHVPIILGALLAYIALLAVHITTPYLNHPLGIGYLSLIAAIFITHKPQSHREYGT